MTVVDASAAAAPGMPAPAAPAVRFVGDRRAYWRILIRGAALLAVTLGIYRFWLATDVRRFLWSNTEVAGETLEYTGTAYELLIGFLIAIALLVPIYLGFAVAALSLGPIGQFASTLSFPLLALLGHFAVYRARRYRLTRTVFRGVRCHQAGSAWRYAICAMFWWVLIALTLGLAYPIAQSRLERFKMRHTYYGDLQGRFEGSGFRLLLRGLPMWLLTVGPLVFALGFGAATVEWDKVAIAAKNAKGGAEFINQLESAFPAVYTAIVVSISAVSVSVTMTAILFPVFQAMILRWWISGVRFGALTVRSNLRTGQIYGAYLRFLWYGLLFATAVSIVAALTFIALNLGLASINKTEFVEIANAIGGTGFYVATMLGFSAIYQGTVKLSLWRCGVDSIEIDGLAVLDAVKAEGVPSSALGEGLADALNVGGF
jgi:uncharacterized membrane protein YjgN (DUF898 family)